MLKVRFAEMNRTVSKAIGASLIGTVDGNGVTTGTYLSGDNSLNFLDGDPTTGITLGDGTNGAFNIGLNSGPIQLNLLLEALESRGMTRSLAEPNLVALSGQKATFHAGGEYPVPVAQDGGEISVEFKPFGVSLQFVPTVVDGDLINLELNTEVSGLDVSNGFTNGSFTISAFTSRKASTTVELRDGQSFAIAGLLEDDFQDLNSQVPWLGDIPVLGALFRSANYQRAQSELVIMITAHLVTPTRAEAIALPTDRVKPPSEQDLFLFGEISKGSVPKRGAAGEVAKQDFSGSYGYVLD
jgi:pilus assembly protein CpaC